MSTPARDPRSLYLTEAMVRKIRRLAETARRTYSSQLQHLIDLGLAHMDTVEFGACLDDLGARQHFYPDDDLDRRILAVVSKRDLSYSAVVRALVMAGLAVTRHYRCPICGPARHLDDPGRAMGHRLLLAGGFPLIPVGRFDELPPPSVQVVLAASGQPMVLIGTTPDGDLLAASPYQGQELSPALIERAPRAEPCG